MSHARIDKAVYHMTMVRGMLKNYLSDLSPDEWLRMPCGGVTHITWQVGHIAAAQYGLCLARARGVRDEDEELMPAAMRTRYGRGSTPAPDPEANDSPDALLRALDAVAGQAAAELSTFSDSELDILLEDPHPTFSTKLGAVEFCPSHELMHIGQVILLRRFLGRQPGR